MNSGTVIKVLKDTKCISPKDSEVLKYEVVTIIDESDDGILIKNIFDEYMLLPLDTLYKILGVKKVKVNNLKAIYKSLKQAKVVSNVSVTASPNPIEPNPFSLFTKPKEKNNKTNSFITRAIQKAQIICSNVLSNQNVIDNSKLVLAAIYANMAGMSGLNNAQANRLLQMANKLIASSNNN